MLSLLYALFPTARSSLRPRRELARNEDESMTTITKSIDISAPVEKVFAYLSDSRNLPEWFVGLSEVTDVSGSGVGQHNRWTYTMIGIPFHGESTPQTSVWSSSKRGE
jgi:uncharacterized membrane protein